MYFAVPKPGNVRNATCQAKNTKNISSNSEFVLSDKPFEFFNMFKQLAESFPLLCANVNTRDLNLHGIPRSLNVTISTWSCYVLP